MLKWEWYADIVGSDQNLGMQINPPVLIEDVNLEVRTCMGSECYGVKYIVF